MRCYRRICWWPLKLHKEIFAPSIIRKRSLQRFHCKAEEFSEYRAIIETLMLRLFILYCGSLRLPRRFVMIPLLLHPRYSLTRMANILPVSPVYVWCKWKHETEINLMWGERCWLTRLTFPLWKRGSVLDFIPKSANEQSKGVFFRNRWFSAVRFAVRVIVRSEWMALVYTVYWVEKEKYSESLSPSVTKSCHDVAPLKRCLAATSGQFIAHRFRFSVMSQDHIQRLSRWGVCSGR